MRIMILGSTQASTQGLLVFEMHMVVSQNKGPQKTQNSKLLNTGSFGPPP